jgi:hypothetical protein
MPIANISMYFLVYIFFKISHFKALTMLENNSQQFPTAPNSSAN